MRFTTLFTLNENAGTFEKTALEQNSVQMKKANLKAGLIH
jgi:hypothetical protein